MSEFIRRFSHPADWTHAPLGNLIDRVYERYSHGETTILTISAIQGLVSQENYFNRLVASADLSTYYQLRRGDFAYNKSYSKGYPFGAIARLEQHAHGVVSPLYICFRLKPDAIDSDFILHCFEAGVLDRGLGDIVKEGARAHGLLNVAIGDFLALTVAYPPPPQQRKIARILTTVDNLIEKTEALIAKYQAIKQGMMHDLFTRGVDEHGHLRPPYEEAPELYKRSELGWIPTEWEIWRVGDRLERIEQGWSPDCESEPASSGEWGVLKTTAVVWEGFACHENKRLPKHLPPLPQYEVHANDVLMTRGGPNSRVGVVVHVRETVGKLMLSDKIYRLIPKRGLLPSYFALALASERTQTHLSTLKTGLAESQTNISQEIVRRLWIGVPKPDEQRKICGRLEAVNEAMQAELNGLAKLRLHKSGLMQDLLTGKVRVKVDDTGGTANA